MADEYARGGAKPTQKSKTSALSGKTLHDVAQESTEPKAKSKSKLAHAPEKSPEERRQEGRIKGGQRSHGGGRPKKEE